MSCRAPVPPLDPLIEPWPQGKIIHRLGPARWLPGLFNPGHGCKPTRFAPIRDRDGKVVPYLYGGSFLECAIFETVFHEVPIDAADPYVELYGDRLDGALEGTRTGGPLRSDDDMRRAILGLALRAGILAV